MDTLSEILGFLFWCLIFQSCSAIAYLGKVESDKATEYMHPDGK